jgi:CRP/FNR family transcriptional regulator, cyclic AMP receptor protein
MKTVNFKAGDIILSEGDDGRSAFLIVNGTVEISVGKGSDTKTVGTFKTGEVFGEMSLIEPGTRAATVKAVTDTECIETSYDEFIATVEHNPQAAMEFMKTLVRRLRHMNELMATMDPKKRTLRKVVDEWQKASDLPGWSDKAEQHRYEELMSWRMI